MQNIFIGIGIVVLGVLGAGYFYQSRQVEPEQNVLESVETTATETAQAETAAGSEEATATEAAASNETPTALTYTLDPTALPLGDGRVSTSPKKGHVYSCTTEFRSGGAWHAGDWITGSTWDSTAKLAVQGSVSWPSASFSAVVQGVQRVLEGNGVPIGSNTGIFPIRSSDPAYQYDTNPNAISARTFSLSIPSNPTVAAEPSCVPMGAVGYALNGVAIYNALDAAGLDAVAHEVQDSCNGHPQGAGQYHYHGPSECIPGANSANTLIGYAMDGFGIFSSFDANGREYTNADLDECHGTTSEITWNGVTVNMYHYVITQEYPYTLGCYRGTPVRGTLPGASPRR